MANELRVRARIDYNPATEDSLSTEWLEKFISMTGTEFIHGVQSIGLTEEAITVIADIATVGFCIFRNLDSTNFVEIGLADVVADDARPIKLKAKEFALFRANGTLYALADTAACRLEYWIFED